MSLRPFDLLLLVLASYRLTHLLVFDKIAEPIRNAVGGRHTPGQPLGWRGYLVRCFWCAGVWISAGLVGLYALSPTVGRWTSLVFAVAGGQSAIEAILYRLNRRRG